jgi:hypothetical protein
MHQAVGNTLRVLSTMDPPQGAVHAEQPVDTAIAEAVYATRCTYSSALKTAPGGLAFSRDMILNIPLVTDLQQLQKRRQELINKRLLAANAKRFSFDYQIGDEVLKLMFQPYKLDPRASAPSIGAFYYYSSAHQRYSNDRDFAGCDRTYQYTTTQAV